MSSEGQKAPYFPERVQVACSQCTLGDLCLPRSLDAQAIEQFGGNISHAASALGITRAALYRRIEKLGLKGFETGRVDSQD